MNDRQLTLAANLTWWSFLALTAYFVTPWILLALLFVPGFSTTDTVTVEADGTTVTVESNNPTRLDIKNAVEEAVGGQDANRGGPS